MGCTEGYIFNYEGIWKPYNVIYMKTKKKVKKKRAKTYDSKLAINGTFKQAIKALVREPKAKKEI